MTEESSCGTGGGPVGAFHCRDARRSSRCGHHRSCRRLGAAVIEPALVPSLLAEIGGGLSAVVNLALGCAVIALYRRNNALQDKMLDMALTMGRENRDLLTVTNATVSASTQTITEAVRRMEDRR